jgi:hypothetical protein
MMPDDDKETQQVSSNGKTPKKKKIFPAVIAAAIFVVFLTMPYCGFILYLAIWPLLIWMAISIVAAVRNAGMRKIHLARVFVWVAAVTIVIGFNAIKVKLARDYANEVVTKVKMFSAAHGHCPETLDEIGVEKQELQEKLGRALYWCENGQPVLYYVVPYIMYDFYSYDFEREAWIYQPG